MVKMRPGHQAAEAEAADIITSTYCWLKKIN